MVVGIRVYFLHIKGSCVRDGSYNNDDDNGGVIDVGVVDGNIGGISEENSIADKLIGDGDCFTNI